LEQNSTCIGQFLCPSSGVFRCAHQWYMSYRFADSLLSANMILLASCQQICMTYTIAVCTVKTLDDGQRNCPKHVDFCSKNKFEKLVHLVGFITRIYHDARSNERQKHYMFCLIIAYNCIVEITCSETYDRYTL